MFMCVCVSECVSGEGGERGRRGGGGGCRMI